MKIYTKTGDSGATGLFGGQRVSKTHPRIEAYGTVDELNSVLGLVRVEPLELAVSELLHQVQHELFELGAQLASPNDGKQAGCEITAASIQRLERAIDDFDAELPKLTQFILPAGNRGACLLHLARTVCRRAERKVVGLAESAGERIAEEAIVYLNRLSDLLFVLARHTNHVAGQPDEPWGKPTANARRQGHSMQS